VQLTTYSFKTKISPISSYQNTIKWQCKKITIDQDIKVICINAQSFPDGVMEAFEKLHACIPQSDERKYFGISQPDQKGNILYKAAAEELEEDEAIKYGYEPFTIKKGNYYCISIKNHMNDSLSIGRAFQKLISLPDIDPEGYCLEWYKNYSDGDVKCMVVLNN
jgi:predicted transcriptional regulator YdeE